MQQTKKLFSFWLWSAPVMTIYSLFVFSQEPNALTMLFWVLTVLGTLIIARIYFHKHKHELAQLHAIKDEHSHWISSYKSVAYFPFWIGLFMLIIALPLAYRANTQVTTIIWLSELFAYYLLFLPGLILPIYASAFSTWEIISFQFKTIAIFFIGIFGKAKNQNSALVPPSTPEITLVPNVAQPASTQTNTHRTSRTVIAGLIGIAVALIILSLLMAGFPEFKVFLSDITNWLNDLINKLGPWKMIALEILGRIVLGTFLSLLLFCFNKGLIKTSPAWWFSAKPEVLEYRLKPKQYKMAGMSSLMFAMPIALVLWVFVVVQLASGGNLPDGITYADYIHAGFGFVLAAILMVYIATAIIGRRVQFNSINKKSGSMGLILLMTLPLYLIIYVGFKRLFLYFDVYGYTELRYYVVIVFILMAIATTALILTHILRLFVKPNIRGWITPLPYLSILGVALALWIVTAVTIPWPNIVVDRELARLDSENQTDVIALCNLPIEAMPTLYEQSKNIQNTDTRTLLRACVYSKLDAKYQQWKDNEVTTKYHPDIANYATVTNMALYDQLNADEEIIMSNINNLYTDFLDEYITLLETGKTVTLGFDNTDQVTSSYEQASSFWDTRYSAISEDSISQEYGDFIIDQISCDDIKYSDIVSANLTPTVYCDVWSDDFEYYGYSGHSGREEWYFTIGVRDGKLVIKDSTMQLANPEDICSASPERCLELGQVF